MGGAGRHTRGVVVLPSLARVGIVGLVLLGSGCGARTGFSPDEDLRALGAAAPPLELPRRAPRVVEPLPAVEAVTPREAVTGPRPPERPAEPPATEMPPPLVTEEPRPLLEPEVVVPDAEAAELPEECRLAPVDPDLPDEGFEVRGSVVEDDYTPTESEAWNWAPYVEDPDWPYPSRALWPERVELPLDEGDVYELAAVAGSSIDDVYVVGQRGEEPLLLHWVDGDWRDESAALLAALPEASRANSVSAPKAEEVWVTTPEGLARSNGAGEWQALGVPEAVYPLGAIWMNADGFGVVAGGTVASTGDGGANWQLETRELGFVAPGLAYARSFVRVSGYGTNVSVVGAYGHLLTRGDDGWAASTLLASDVAFTADGQFVTSRSTSQGLFFRESPETWQIYPLSWNGGLDRVWASPEGDVFAGGYLSAVLHRFPDGTVELLPSESTELIDFYGDASRLYSLEPRGLWLHDLGDERSSGASEAALVDESLLSIAPAAEDSWGQSAASNFEPLLCVDHVLTDAGAPAWQGELAANRAEARYGSCSNADAREYSETAFSFTAPTTGTYRIALDETEAASRSERKLQLALRNGCEGWMIYGGGFSGGSSGVDIGLLEGQVLLIEVYATEELDAPVPFELAIY